jgi:hypothetical protein
MALAGPLSIGPAFAETPSASAPPEGLPSSLWVCNTAPKFAHCVSWYWDKNHYNSPWAVDSFDIGGGTAVTSFSDGQLKMLGMYGGNTIGASYTGTWDKDHVVGGVCTWITSAGTNNSTFTARAEPLLPSRKAATLLAEKPNPSYRFPMMGIQLYGTVYLRFTVSPEGGVTSVRALPDPLSHLSTQTGAEATLMAQGAQASVNQLKFHPYLVNGEPTAFETSVRIHYVPTGGNHAEADFN